MRAAERLHVRRAELHYKTIQVRHNRGQWILSASRSAYFRAEPWRSAVIQPEWDPRAKLVGSEAPPVRRALWLPVPPNRWRRAKAYLLKVDGRDPQPPPIQDDHDERAFSRELVELAPLSWDEYRALLRDQPDYFVARVEARVDPVATRIHRASCSVLGRQQTSQLAWANRVMILAPVASHLDYWIGACLRRDARDEKPIPRCGLCFPRIADDDIPF
jgi:hypothetical protein